MSFTNGLYVSFRFTKLGVFKHDGSKTAKWFLLDQTNGNPESGHGYMWQFETVESARRFLCSQNSAPDRAVLCGPYHVDALTKSFVCMARFDFEPEYYKDYL